MYLGGEDWVDVGLGESFVVHALKEETDGRGVGHVRGRRGASTAGEEAPDLESNGKMAYSLEVSALSPS
jgi:hypothetical protein